MSFIKKISILTALTVISALLISLGNMHFLSSKYNEQFYQAVSDNLYSNTMQFSKQLETVNSLSMMTFSSSVIQSSLAAINQNEDKSSYVSANTAIPRVIANYMQSYRYTGLKAISIYNQKYSHSTDIQLASSLKEEIDAALLAASEKNGAPSYSFIPEKNLLILSRKIRQIENLTLSHLGDMVFFIDMNEFMDNVITPGDSYKSPLYFLYDGSELVYSSSKDKNDIASYLYDNYSGDYRITSYNGTTYFCVMNKIPDYDWYLLNAIPYNLLTSATKSIIRNSVLIYLAAFMILYLLDILLLRYAFDDYHKLVKKMKNFDISAGISGDDISEYADRTDEIGLLHKQFNSMSLEIHNLIQKNYVNELLKRDAQLKELKAQINPHFLYNTLETINWRAKALHDDKTSAIIESLGFIFRASLDKTTSLVTLTYEMDLINAYMLIQKIRFEDRLEFKINCPEDIKSCLIPPMTVQPLLENAIKYGMETMIDVCFLDVDIHRENNLIIITVMNDGSEFEDDIIMKLENGDIKASGHGIGLLNIKKRIQLLFGDEYGLEVYNSEDRAVARITIPYTRENQE